MDIELGALVPLETLLCSQQQANSPLNMPYAPIRSGI